MTLRDNDGGITLYYSDQQHQPRLISALWKSGFASLTCIEDIAPRHYLEVSYSWQLKALGGQMYGGDAEG